MVEKLTYNVKEAAKALGISSSLLYRKIENGTCDIPYYRIGGRILFSIKVVKEYVDSCGNVAE